MGMPTASRGFASLLYLSLLSTLVPSQAVAVPISYAQCIDAARARSPQAVRGALGETYAGAASQESLRQRYPQLTAIANLDHSDTPQTQAPDSNKAMLHVEQSEFPWSSSWLKGNQRQAEAEAGRFARVESEEDAVLLAKQLYFSILRQSDAIERLLEVDRQLGTLSNSVIPRFSLGRAPQFDLVKVKTALADLARTRDLRQQGEFHDRQLDMAIDYLRSQIKTAQKNGGRKAG